MKRKIALIAMTLVFTTLAITALAWENTPAAPIDTAINDASQKETADAVLENEHETNPTEPAKIVRSDAPWTDDDFTNIAFYDVDESALEAVATNLPGNFIIKSVDCAVYAFGADGMSLLLPGDVQHLLMYETYDPVNVKVGTIVTIYILLAV